MSYKKLLFLISCFLLGTLESCGPYSFTGADTGGASSFQVNYFQNTADIIEPGIERVFKLELEDLIQNQTNLTLTNEGGDLIYEGEIIDYYVAPMTATAQNTAAQNRLTITINVRFYNTIDPERDYEKRYSFYFDFPAERLLTGPTLDSALDEIYNRITQDIFNDSLTNW